MDMLPRRLHAADWRDVVASAVYWLAVITVVCDLMAWVDSPQFWLQVAYWSLALLIGTAVFAVLTGSLRLIPHRAVWDRRQAGAYLGIGLACFNFILRGSARDQILSVAGLALSTATLALLLWASRSPTGDEGGIEPPTGVY